MIPISIWRRFVALPGPEKRLVLRALGTVGGVRLALWIRHPRVVLERVESTVAEGPVRGGPSLPADRVAWAVRAVSRRLPAATCLVQALAARLVLARHGHPSVLQIGALLTEEGELEAHAWAEVDGRPVTGGRGTGRYSRFPDLRELLPHSARPARRGDAP